MQKCIAGSNALVTLSDGLILSVERSQHKVNDMKGGKSARRGDTEEQRTKEKRRKEVSEKAIRGKRAVKETTNPLVSVLI